ncbi:MAG: zinc ribbon domain-containing protein [Thermoplasmata archaeon]|nr:zinc ribbon domain-containing protein [Thermoplasmata archaeon]
MPFRQLFTKREHRILTGVKKDKLVQSISNFWSQSQFGISFVGPFQIHGERLYSKIGLRQVVDIWIQDSGKNVMIDLMFSATLGDEEAVIGAIGAVVVLPVAVAVGAVSYLEYENEANNLVGSFWNFLTSIAVSGKGSISSPLPVQPAPLIPISCPKCKATVDSDSQYCKKCGEKIITQ